MLELVDQPLAGVERLSAVRRRDSDHDTDLANLERSSAMNQGNLGVRPSPMRLLGQLFHLLFRHRAVRLVDQRSNLFATRLLSNDSLEDHERPIAVAAETLGDRRWVEWILAQSNKSSAFADRASAYRRDDRQLVAVLEWIVPAR